MDTVDAAARSRIMSRIRSKGTRPELAVEAFLHASGASFEWQPDLSGRPDFLVEGRTALFVNGCFWHGCPEHYREPKTRTEFWRAKIVRNCKRQEQSRRRLRRIGFRTMAVWEHEIRSGEYKGRLWKIKRRP